VSGNARRLYVEIAGSNLSGYGEEKLYKEFEAIRPFVTGHLKLYADGGYYDTIQF
jgi:putative N-acetylmannosamine-6-phosphate epimerase